MSEVVEKVRRLLESGAADLRVQGVEMVLTLEDPDVDAWTLSTVETKAVRRYDEDWAEDWDLPPGLVELERPRIPLRALLEVLRRTPPDSPASADVSGRLRRLIVYRDDHTTAVDLSWLRDLPVVTDLVVTGQYSLGWHFGWSRLDPFPVTGVDALAALPALTRLVAIGLTDLDLAALAALPGLRRLTLRKCTVAAGSGDLSGSTVERLDLVEVSGLTDLTPPATLRELHLADLGDLVGIGDLSAATGLTDLSVLDCPSIAALPPLPAGPALRRVWLFCPALTSIAPLAGRPLEHLDLTGCAALTDLGGFPERLAGPRLSLAGCTRLTDLSAVVSAGAGLRCVDLRGLAGVTDVTAFDRLPDLGTLALAGTATSPRTVPASLLPSCTWAHTPNLDLLWQRPRVRP